MKSTSGTSVLIYIFICLVIYKDGLRRMLLFYLAHWNWLWGISLSLVPSTKSTMRVVPCSTKLLFYFTQSTALWKLTMHSISGQVRVVPLILDSFRSLLMVEDFYTKVKFHFFCVICKGKAWKFVPQTKHHLASEYAIFNRWASDLART